MTTFEEIKARHARIDNPGSTWTHERVARELDMAHDDRAALIAMVERFQWRPIAEGREPEGSVMVGGPSFSCEAWFDKEHGGWWVAGTHFTDAHDGRCYPTHFMPLPSPPSDGGG